MAASSFASRHHRSRATGLLLASSVWFLFGCGASSSSNGHEQRAGSGNAIAGAGAVLGAAGGSGAATTDGPFPPSQAIKTATSTIAQAACARLFACCEASYLDVLGFPDEADCRSTYSARLASAVNANRSAIEAGRLAVHLEVADSCADDLACEGSPFRCSNVFQPLVADGDSCVFATECLSGSCTGTPKTCRPPQPSGADCTFDEDCISRLCQFLVCKGDTPPRANEQVCRK